MGYFEPQNAPEHFITRGEMAYFMAWLLNEDGTDQIDLLANRTAFNIKTMTSDDCYENEYFDVNDQLCYLSDQGSNLEIEQWNNDNHQHESNYEENRYIRYKVNGNTIEFFEDNSEFAPELSNTTIHTAIWQTFTNLIPTQYRNNIDYFDVMISVEGTSAHVEPVTDVLDSWTLAIDINEFSLPGPNDEYKEFVATLVHELAHIISLNNTQIDGSVEDASECRPSFHIEEGCALSTSIIQAYYHNFWAKELNGIYRNSYNPNDFGESLYYNYPQHFITEYAASNPVEDLAEHFAYFVIQNTPSTSSNSRIDQKLLFFYQFAPMVDLRNRIRKVLETQL